MNLALPIAAAFFAAAVSAEARPKPRKSPRKAVTKCPAETKPTRTVDPREPWACVLIDEKYREGIECPRGSRAITTANPYDPFKCALSNIRIVPPRGICPPGERAIPTSDPDKDFDCEKLGKGFQRGPRCPRGTKPVPTPDALQPFTCIARSFKPSPTEPVLEPSFEKKRPRRSAKPGERTHERAPKRCPRGTRRIETEDPFEPVRCVRADRGRPARLRYKPYRIRGELSFRYPRGWTLHDSWREDPPSIHIMPEADRDGRPVTLSIVRERSGRPDFVDFEARVWKEKDWHGAEEKGRGRVNGAEAVHLEVPSQSAMTLVKNDDGYFVLAYSAPVELFAHYESAYRTLLKSFAMRSFDETR